MTGEPAAPTDQMDGRTSQVIDGESEVFPIESLPLEMLQRVISNLDVWEVTRNCLLVSKRWEMASRSDLRTRRFLTIRSFDNDQDPWPGKERESFNLNKNMIKAAAKCLKVRMPGIQYLFITEFDFKSQTLVNWCCESFAILIFSLAPNLKGLHIPHMNLPIEQGVSYQSLIELECQNMGNQTMAACPVLQVMKCEGSFTATVIPLTVQKMDVVLDMRTDWHLKRQIDGITRLVSLTHLKLNGRARDPDSFSHSDGLQILRLFHAFEALVSFDADFRGWDSFTSAELDEAFEVLTGRNHGLEKIRFLGLSTSDHVLSSISRLQKLKDLILDYQTNQVTSQGIMSLFTGSSARVLERVVVDFVENTEFSDVQRQEIESIPSEKPRTFNYTGRTFFMKT